MRCFGEYDAYLLMSKALVQMLTLAKYDDAYGVVLDYYWTFFFETGDFSLL